MKKLLLFFIAFTSFSSAYSQTKFERGYYINNSNQKVDCFIKNVDWYNNPTSFEFKLTEDSEKKSLTIKNVKEFAIYNSSKYIRENVRIDRSSEKVNDLSNSENPLFKEEQLFLKVLIEGKSNLYLYKDKSLIRYFFNVENTSIEQLIFKKYLSPTNKLLTNNGFRKQLWEKLKCSSIKMSTIKKLDYKKNHLINIFIDYNICSNTTFTEYSKKTKKGILNLSLRPRFNSSSLEINKISGEPVDVNFGNNSNFGIGLEVEYILPFNNNKWSISFEPSYQNYKGKETANANHVSGGILMADVDYTSIEVPISFRHYFYLNNNSKVYANVSYVIDVSSNSSIEFTRNDNSKFDTLEIVTDNNFAFGIGYKFNNKYSIEMRYLSDREILVSSAFWNSGYETLSLIFGYTFF